MRNKLRILLIEDLSTDGQSKIHFCNAIRKAGAKVSSIFVIFNNGLLNVVMIKIDLVKASGLCWLKIDRRDRLGCGGKEIVL